MYPAVKVGNALHRRAATLLILLFTTVVDPAMALTNSGEQNKASSQHLLAALIAVGGGPTTFSAQKLRRNLGGAAEEVKLRHTCGVAVVRRFDQVFTFVVNDALSTMKRSGAPLSSPIPDPANRQAVAKALFKAGLHNGQFNIEHLFDTLFSQEEHMHAMMAVEKKYGAPGESAYHQVFGQLIADVGNQGKPVEIKADEHMYNMHNMKGMDMKNMPMPSPAATQSPH
jgi:hypothetical protein